MWGRQQEDHLARSTAGGSNWRGGKPRIRGGGNRHVFLTSRHSSSLSGRSEVFRLTALSFLSQTSPQTSPCSPGPTAEFFSNLKHHLYHILNSCVITFTTNTRKFNQTGLKFLKCKCPLLGQGAGQIGLVQGLGELRLWAALWLESQGPPLLALHF